MANTQHQTMLNLAVLDARAFEALSGEECFATIAGFHAQQAVEKALKAVLGWSGVTYPLTHNLAVLLDCLNQVGIDCPVSRHDIRLLIPYAVGGRYDESTGGLTIASMRATTTQVLDWAKHLIGVQAA